MQHLFVAVGERDVLADANGNGPPGSRCGFAVVEPCQRALLLEQLFGADHTGLRRLQLLELVDDPLERAADELGVLEQDEQRADGDRARPLQADADGEQQRGAER